MYKRFDNYDCINVDSVRDIPMDYYGEIGVPISFLDKWNTEQYDIVYIRRSNFGEDLMVDGKLKFTRIVIRRKLDEEIQNN